MEVLFFLFCIFLDNSMSNASEDNISDVVYNKHNMQINYIYHSAMKK